VHPDGERAAEILAEEMKHFGLLAGLIQGLTGKEVVPDELHGLEEDRTLQALRADLRKRGGELERAAVTFTEGGGGSMYAVLEGLDGSDFDRDVAAAFREIHTDEVIHGPMQIHRIAEHARKAEDWERCTQIAVSICRQRLQMRNEMFGRPLSGGRIEEIEAGKIEPWPIPIEI
jgi:hypothetical protein